MTMTIPAMIAVDYPLTDLVITQEMPADYVEREALLDHVMGEGRKRKSSEKLREHRLPAQGLAFITRDKTGKMIGTVRLWDISAGRNKAGSPVPALLLGPLAVDLSLAGRGVGTALMYHAIAAATELGHQAILLVGDADYYRRFGFSVEKTAQLAMPGPVERGRFLALELEKDYLSDAQGLLIATGTLGNNYLPA